MKMTKEQFDKLYSDNITKKEYDEIINLIDKRFQEIVNLVFSYIREGRNWYDYSNVNFNSGDNIGYFNIDEYKDNICIGGENSFPEPYCLTDEGNGYFPTRWLWTENEEIKKEYQKEISQSRKDKEQERLISKQKRLDLKAEKLEFKKIIMSKLTKEELKYIKFK